MKPLLLAAGAGLLALSACEPATPALTRGEVEQFVRDYVAAANAGDASQLMGLVERNAAVSSISYGRISRGWGEMRAGADQALAAANPLKISIGSVEVVALGDDAALAVATMKLAGIHQIGTNVAMDLPGAFTMVVRRTPQGLRLVHEHYSARAP